MTVDMLFGSSGWSFCYVASDVCNEEWYFNCWASLSSCFATQFKTQEGCKAELTSGSCSCHCDMCGRQERRASDLLPPSAGRCVEPRPLRFLRPNMAHPGTNTAWTEGRRILPASGRSAVSVCESRWISLYATDSRTVLILADIKLCPLSKTFKTVSMSLPIVDLYSA